MKAVDAAVAAGVTLQTIHRMVERGDLSGARAGVAWYVRLDSLLEYYAEAPPILARVKALAEAQ